MLLNRQRLNHSKLLSSRINYHRRSEFTEKISHRQQARSSAIAHNEALKQQTLSAKASKVAMQALATVGNMFVSWAISKVIETAVKAIDKYVNAWEHATEAVLFSVF